MGGRGIETKTRGKESAGEKICNFSSSTHPGQQRDGGRKVLGTGYAILVHMHPYPFSIRLQLHFFLSIKPSDHDSMNGFHDELRSYHSMS